jgi:1,4-alpha-glucan branching enzyme
VTPRREDSVNANGTLPYHKGPWGASLLTPDDLYLFNEGSHFELHHKLGAHPLTVDGVAGTYFAVWAPGAERVAVIGDFNGWNPDAFLLHGRENSGIWEGFVPGAERGQLYKYHIQSRYLGYQTERADPFGVYHQEPPGTASRIWTLEYTWNDADWIAQRPARQRLDAPISIYEVHLGSWRRGPDNQFLTYREIAPLLADYVLHMGYTHVEFLPVMEHPFYASWGYQVTGYFATTARYGTPQDFMYLVDHLHQKGIGVILDWVPSHFPTDGHALKYFDGTHLYEHADERQGMHRDWNTAIFNYGRNEVVSFLTSNALFWLDKYHIDGLRVDAVASMLYLDYSRNEGDWIPNRYGGRENLEAMGFIRRLNETVYDRFPATLMVAEESTAWAAVSRPTYVGGLGFGYKWDMGWMHDTLKYMSVDPIFRKYHHNELTFRMLYAWTENFVLALSHDEVVHGKGSLISKMPGDWWQKFANMRLLLAWMTAQPGKKLMFMGGEFGQFNEWYHETSLDWFLLDFPTHRGVQLLARDLNRLYKHEQALHQLDCEQAGFEWVDVADWEQSTLSFLRRGKNRSRVILAVANFTPEVRRNYRIGVPFAGHWRELLNTDGKEYGGSGVGNGGGAWAEQTPWQNRPFSLNLTLPPLALTFFAGTES